MNASVRRQTQLRSMKPPSRHEKEREEMKGTKAETTTKSIPVEQGSSKERKLALQQDVKKLKKKLRREENIHRALERAFNRPVGALPRLPPYLPTCTLELLAEVAVLEEEVVRLEEQVVHFRQDLYQEAVSMSSSKRILDIPAHLCDTIPIQSPRLVKSTFLGQAKLDLISTGRLQTQTEEKRGKENQLCSNSANGSKISGNKNKPRPTTNQVKRQSIQNKLMQKSSHFQKTQQGKCSADQAYAEIRTTSIPKENTSQETPNMISENILKCLARVLLRMSTETNRTSSGNSSQEGGEGISVGDPYDTCAQFGKRDIGRYKQLLTIDAQTFNSNRTTHTLFLRRQLKILFRKLASVKLENLTHQEKIAFWINVYNSCMMHAFIENGIPDSAETVVMLMQKATINVGGHILNAMTIEHFILRLPYHCKLILGKGAKNSEITARSIFRLEFSEPLVTFALSCGSWSSPAVRVYTASQVETELEVAKTEYLQAAIGISTTKFAIPKLLDWYLLDFAKDLESLLDWVCLQLPSELGKEAIKLLERRRCETSSKLVHIMPYEFSFRYILSTVSFQ